MLSTTNPSSSIQRRRQMHRRQNSLEVPMLATPLPATSRRSQGAHHRRGLSLEQAMSLLPRQEVSIPTNQQRPASQHSVQETQQHRPYQPGFFPMESQQLQQQLQQQQFYKQEIVPAEQFFPVKHEVAPAEQAIKNLEQHIQSVYQAYGYVPHTQAPQPQPQLPNTPIIVATQPTTPPSTYGQVTPMSAKQGRAERALLDVSPMPSSFSSHVPLVQVQDTYIAQDNQSLYAESFAGDYTCASSYASSLVDPSSPVRSPVRQMNTMPTVYETILPATSQAAFTQDSMFFPASSSPYYPASPHRLAAMSPREAMLQTMDIDASIEDTGISAEEVQRYISPQDPEDSKWTCLFDGCRKKFGRKENIRSHVQTHLGDRQFKCNHCGKCFVRQHDLKRHAKIHSGDKPHKCPCGNGFARQDALTRHRQRGVCEGALPGFERRDVRRGRPRKARPDMADRLEKAARARGMDLRRGSEDTYASSSDSDRSYPDTPPPASDAFDDDAFANLTDDSKFDAFELSRYTPPTSPFSTGASPIKQEGTLNAGYAAANVQVLAPAASPRSSPPALPQSPPSSAHCPSAPFGANAFGFHTSDSKALEFVPVEVFSPTATSSSGSEFDHFSPPATTGVESAFMGSEDMLDFNTGMYGADDSLFNNSLDAWLESH